MTSVNITIPTYNEEKIIGQKIDQLFDYAKKNLSTYQWLVIVADNGSTDHTMDIIKEKSKQYQNLKYFHLNKPGKGRAVLTSWQNNLCDINIFMDADLSTDLKSLPDLINPIESKECDLVSGSRLHKKSQTQRSFFRSLVSRSYNLIIKILFNLGITDTSCGFKSVSQKIVKNIVPKIKNKSLFFDTELLILAHFFKYSQKEISIVWQEEKQRKTKIKIIDTSFNYLKELIKIKLRLIRNRA